MLARLAWNDVIGPSCRSHRGFSDCMRLWLQRDHNLRFRTRRGSASLVDQLRMSLRALPTVGRKVAAPVELLDSERFVDPWRCR
jgi:hypothetical protein